MKPCHIDGVLFCLITFFTAVSGSLMSDGAAKHIPETMLWWSQQFSLWCNATVLGLKMYRSTSYAKYRDVEDVKMVRKTENEEAVQAAATVATVKSILPSPLPPQTVPTPPEVSKTIAVAMGFAIVWMCISAGCTHKPSTLAVTPEQSAETVNRLEQQIKTNLSK